MFTYAHIVYYISISCGLLRVSQNVRKARLCSFWPCLYPALSITFPFCTVRSLNCMISTSSDFGTLKICFHPLYRCTCRKGYVGDGSTCYGNIMERLKELNTEPRGKWQGRLTSFISLLGMQAWGHISTEKAALWWARASETHSHSGGVPDRQASYLAGAALSRNGKWKEMDRQMSQGVRS